MDEGCCASRVATACHAVVICGRVWKSDGQSEVERSERFRMHSHPRMVRMRRVGKGEEAGQGVVVLWGHMCSREGCGRNIDDQVMCIVCGVKGWLLVVAGNLFWEEWSLHGMAHSTTENHVEAEFLSTAQTTQNRILI